MALDRAVEADEIVTALRGYGLTQADTAAAVGVTDRAVRGWTKRTTLRRSHEERLQALRQIVLMLDGSLSPPRRRAVVQGAQSVPRWPPTSGRIRKR